LARTIYTALNNNLSVPPHYLEKFYRECTDVGYTRLVKTKIAVKKLASLLPKGESVVLLLDGSTQTLNKVIQGNKGKLIYLDFWASWCSPCRDEMVSSAVLADTFKTREVIFIYLSIDTNTSDWSKASQEEDLKKENSYLILNAEKSPLIIKYKIHTIPRYMLIGKNSQIISTNAPRPSDSSVIALIKKHL
jgi:thiol-disulfide isomerase/thioredoxin